MVRLIPSMLTRTGTRVALTLLILGLASVAFAEDWKNLPYLLYQGGEMWLGTDRATWSGVDNVSLSPGGQQSLDDSRPIWVKGVGYGGTPQKADLHYVWAPSCPQVDQTVSFVRIFLSPGAPTEASFNLTTVPEDWQFKKRIYKSIEVTLNGTTLARISGQLGAYGKFTPEQLRAFNLGANKLTISVQRLALDKGERCNVSGGKLVGVELEVRARFGAELVAQPSVKGLAQTIRLPADGKGVSFTGKVTFSNAGPSLAPEGFIELAGGGPGDLLFVATAMTGCKQVDSTLITGADGKQHFANGSVRCPFTDFRPGTDLTREVVGGYHPAGASSKAISQLTLTWEISTIWPYNPSRRLGTHTVTVCGSAVSQASCK